MASKRLGFVSDGSSLVGEDLKETQTFPKKKLKQKVCFFLQNFWFCLPLDY